MRIVTLGWFMVSAMVPGNAKAEWNLMPQPARMTPGPGRLKADSSFRIALSGYSEPRLERAAARLMHRLSATTGLLFGEGICPDTSQAALDIAIAGPSSPVEKLGEDESYRLEVTPAQAHITAPNPLGALGGMETFLQLAEPDVDSFSAPALRIDDRPRFGWRGLMMDVSRNWLPLEVAPENARYWRARKKPRAELLLMIVAPVRKLMDGANAHA
jgi:hexosaminidase